MSNEPRVQIDADQVERAIESLTHHPLEKLKLARALRAGRFRELFAARTGSHAGFLKISLEPTDALRRLLAAPSN
jgi:hypothetical protein